MPTTGSSPHCPWSRSSDDLTRIAGDGGSLDAGHLEYQREEKSARASMSEAARYWTSSTGTFWGSRSVTTRTRNEWGDRNLGRPASAKLRLRLCCTARAAVRFGGQPVCGRLIVTAEKGGSCRSGSVNGTSRVDSQMAVPVIHKYAFPDLISFQAVTAPCPRVRGADPGDRKWTGATPPFCCPNRARRHCANHICATPPGGVAPV